MAGSKYLNGELGRSEHPAGDAVPGCMVGRPAVGACLDCESQMPETMQLGFKVAESSSGKQQKEETA